PAPDEPRDVALADVLRGLLEVPGKWKLLSELSGNRDDRPPLVGGLPRLGLVGGPAHLDLRDAGLSGAATAIERFDHLGVRRDADVAVADLPRELGGLLSGARDVDGRRLVREGVDPRAVHGVVLPRAGDELPSPQRTDDVDRLLEHLPADGDAGPPVAEDVLVEVLSG